MAARFCKLCMSPFREEFMRAWKNGFPRRMLYQKYLPLMWHEQKISFESFLQAVYKHEDHKLTGVMVVPTETAVGKDVQGIAKMMTELYSRKLEGMTPEEITTKDYTAVNKVAQDETKLSLDRNAQMLEFAKVFGIPEPLKGQEIHDEFGPPKDEGDKQENT